MLIPIVVCTVGLVIVHLFGARLRFLDGTPRSIWLSAAGGISVAYVFIDLLPELAEGQEIIRRAVRGVFSALDHHAYLMALCGLVVFYGLERAAKESHVARHTGAEEDTPDGKVFWLHMTSFSLYNVLIGYLLAQLPRVKAARLFLHRNGAAFIVTDFGLSRDFKRPVARPLGPCGCDYSGYGHWDLREDTRRRDKCAGRCPGRRRHPQRLEGRAARRAPKSIPPFLIGAAAYAGLLLTF
ncbi:hypothetical protein [Caballeronia grimmiae]|uniref:hypothetical protein n=1 Tax=Caballeronia grimmiae TaxID=1071679 RepID=UPI0038BBD25F